MQIPLLKIRDMNQNRKVLLKQRNRRCIGWVSGNRDNHHSCVTCNGGFSNAGKGFFVNQRHQRMLDSGRQLFHAVEAKQSTGSAFYQPAPAFAALERHVLAVTKELVQEGLRRSFVFTAVDDDIRRVLCNGADGDRVQVKIDGPKPGVMGGVLIRANDKCALDFHIDTDDGNAFLLKQGQLVTVLGKEE